MTEQELRQVFGRFQNLNLLFLIEDLRRGLVARGAWVVEENLCPIAHGWRSGWGFRCNYDDNSFDRAGLPVLIGRQFTEWWDMKGFGVAEKWDRGFYNRYKDRLLAALESIYAERLADADAVQEVCCAKTCEGWVREDVNMKAHMIHTMYNSGFSLAKIDDYLKELSV